MDHSKPPAGSAPEKADRRGIVIAGIALFLAMGYLVYESFTPEWRSYQDGFRGTVTEKFGPARASSLPTGIQQVTLDELGRVDRCMTCHLGFAWNGLENAPEPFRSHPKEILEHHPVEKFGCTPCHGGQGMATTADDAHGPSPYWEEPLLGSALGEFYVMADKKALMQINCNTCHRYEKTTPGAGYINRAKEIVNQRGCRACHVINGRGGTVGPDLTWEGMKNPEQFDYARLKGFPTSFTWHVAHLKNPKELVPETVMPNFNFASADAQSLAMLVLSWRKEQLPLSYIPFGAYRDTATAEEKAKEERMLSGPGSFFVKKTCFVCHAISSLGIDAAAQIGPDLSMAVEDVQSRFGRTLDDFLTRPTGTMEVVLSTMITLTPEERDEAIAKLRMAYQLKKSQR